MALVNGWKNEGTRFNVLKKIFGFVLEHDVILNLVYVKSAENVADAPSRSLNKINAFLTCNTWDAVQKAFGGGKGHTVDLMALDSNCMNDLQGKPLKHYSPFRTPGSAGIKLNVNVSRELLRVSTLQSNCAGDQFYCTGRSKLYYNCSCL